MPSQSYADYESAARGNKALPVFLIQGLLNVLLRRGDPPIAEEEILELGGFRVLSDRLKRLVSAFEKLPAPLQEAHEKLIIESADKQG